MLQWSCQVCTEFARSHFWSRRHLAGRGFPHHWRLAGAMSICQHPSFFLALITKLLMGRVCSIVCVSLCPLQRKKVWRHLSQCAFSFFLYAGTPPRVIDKNKQNINKRFTMGLTGTWTNRRDTCLGCSSRSLDLGWKLGNSEVWRVWQICHHSNVTNIHRLVWNLQVKSKKKSNKHIYLGWKIGMSQFDKYLSLQT